ncbi:CLUMA_CG020072, isoform A [Clunio marinus]|uniref:CLUMA_CG020072, isoform A n=1 Tax=Clunio marinus TaxID=568069 RepID=A0A1J1J3F2_9DIPT|nr:CLUMA_CG020072, isoform A [Clunio marinus]
MRHCDHIHGGMRLMTPLSSELHIILFENSLNGKLYVFIMNDVTKEGKCFQVMILQNLIDSKSQTTSKQMDKSFNN